MSALRLLTRLPGVLLFGALFVVLTWRDAVRESRLKRQLGAHYEGPAAEEDES